MSTEQVLAQLQSDGDRVIRVYPTSDSERRSWLRAVRQIRKQGLSPTGFHIRYLNESAWGVKVWLEPGDDPHELRRAQQRAPVPVPDRVHRLHAVVARLREAGQLPVSKAVLQRALHLLHAVAVEGERRGYEVEALQGEQAALSLTVNGFAYPVSISEEKDRVAHVLTAYERKEMARSSWFRPPEWDYEPSGRLVLALPSTGRSNRYRWTDRERWRLDQKLPDLFAEIEARAITDQQRKQEAERKAAVLRAEWEEVRRRATARLEEAHRAEWLDTQMERWGKAANIRAYLAELHANRKLTEAEEAWLTWAADYANRLILASKSVAPPPLAQPDPSALQPYMEGWSAYEPRPPLR